MTNHPNRKIRRTKEPLTMTWGKGHPSLHATFTVPAATRVKPCDDGTGQFWVDDLSFLDPKTQGITIHDATYYGIRLNPEQVTD